MFSLFKKRKNNIIFESNVNNFDENKLNIIYERLTNYKDNCNTYEPISNVEIESKNIIIGEKLLVKIPNDYKQLLQKSNGIYFGNGIKLLNCDEILEETVIFRDMMEDWEIGRITKPFLEIIRYHDGNGFVFWYSEINKYVVADYITDYELDDLKSLKTFDNICEVIEDLENRYIKK